MWQIVTDEVCLGVCTIRYVLNGKVDVSVWQFVLYEVNRDSRVVRWVFVVFAVKVDSRSVCLGVFAICGKWGQ